jgi:hypothetical protein
VKLIKHSARANPRLSLILVDWSVRESFHLLHYLARQDVARDAFEVIVVEYYSRVSEVVRRFEDQVDTWVALEMPEASYYHKHLMYNAGIFFARGGICVICDSDAMVREGFLRAILAQFEQDPGIVLHLDQFRNARRDLYPFCYPSFEDVIGRGCINNVGGRTRGLHGSEDSIHNRNYGACMCARREDLVAIGGADEHADYLGHICGPYEMTFRLVNLGRREKWHPGEYLYHTWHPGQAGEDNYLGPHDGRHVSTTALDALSSGRIMPLVENESIRALRQGAGGGQASFRIDPSYAAAWARERLGPQRPGARRDPAVELWRGFVIECRADGYVGFPQIVRQPAFSALRERLEVRAATLAELREKLVVSLRPSVRMALPALILVSYLLQGLGLAWFLARSRLRRIRLAAQS